MSAMLLLLFVLPQGLKLSVGNTKIALEVLKSLIYNQIVLENLSWSIPTEEMVTG
jgi:hypothetical protein